MKYWLFDGTDVIGPFAPHKIAERNGFSVERTLVCPETESENPSAWKEAQSFEDFSPEGLLRSQQETQAALEKEALEKQQEKREESPKQEPREELPPLPVEPSGAGEVADLKQLAPEENSAQPAQTPTELLAPQTSEEQQLTPLPTDEVKKSVLKETVQTKSIVEKTAEKPQTQLPPVPEDNTVQTQATEPEKPTAQVEEIPISTPSNSQVNSSGKSISENISDEVRPTQTEEPETDTPQPLADFATSHTNSTARQAAHEGKMPFAPQLVLWIMGATAMGLAFLACAVWIIYSMYYTKPTPTQPVTSVVQTSLEQMQVPSVPPQTPVSKNDVSDKPSNTSMPLPPPVTLSRTDSAIELVKNYQLSDGKGSVENYLNRLYRTQFSQGYTADWSADRLHKNSYIVKYRLTKTRTEPVVYVFQVDVETGKLTGALNNITLDLVGKI